MPAVIPAWLAGPPSWVELAAAAAWLAYAWAAAAGRLSYDVKPTALVAWAAPLVGLWLVRLLMCLPTAPGPVAAWLVLPAVGVIGMGRVLYADPDLLKRVPGVDWPQWIGNTAVRPVCRTPGFHARFCAEAAVAPGGGVLFLGDSLTTRWRTDGKATWDECFAPLGAINFGVGEDRTQHLLWRVTHGELAGRPPQTVVVLIGTNNLGRNTPAEVADGIGAVVAAVRERQPAADVVLLGLLPRGRRPEDAIRREVNAVNDWLRSAAAAWGVTYVDAGPALLAADGTLDTDVMPDGLHLSAEGYRRLAGVLRRVLWVARPESAKGVA